MADTVLLMWGDVPFEIGTLAYDQLQRSTAWRWVAAERFGRVPAQQFIGPGEVELKLSGTIYREIADPDAVVQQLLDAAAAGEPYDLISGGGDVLDRYVLLAVSEAAEGFFPDGQTRKVKIDLTFKLYGDDAEDEDGAEGEVEMPDDLDAVADDLPDSDALAEMSDTLSDLGYAVAQVEGIAGAVLDVVRGGLSLDTVLDLAGPLVGTLGLGAGPLGEALTMAGELVSEGRAMVDEVKAVIADVGGALTGVLDLAGGEAFAACAGLVRTVVGGDGLDISGLIDGACDVVQAAADLGSGGLLDAALDAAGIDPAGLLDDARLIAGRFDAVLGSAQALVAAGGGAAAVVGEAVGEAGATLLTHVAAKADAYFTAERAAYARIV